MDGSPRKRARRSNSFSSLFGTDPSSSSEEDEVILTHGRKPIPLHNGGSLMVPSTITRPHTAVTNAPLIRRKVNLILPPRTQIRPTEARHTVKHKNLQWAKDSVEEIAPIKVSHALLSPPIIAALTSHTINRPLLSPKNQLKPSYGTEPSKLSQSSMTKGQNHWCYSLD